MFDFWKSSITEDEAETLVAKAAKEIRQRKLEAPAILVLESHKPFANVGSHAAIAFAPFIVPFLGFDMVHDYARLFSRPENVEKLIVELEKKNEIPGEGSVDG